MPFRLLFASFVLVAALAAALGDDATAEHVARPAPPAPPADVVPTRTPGRERPPIVVAVQTSERVVALTFDDGPDPRWTPAVLDALRAADARATFFVTGEHARAHPELLVRTVAEGHELANHTDTHPMIDTLSGDAVLDEVRRAGESVGAAGVPQAPYFRPPKGRYGSEALDAVGRTGLRTIGWTVCFERWLRRGGPILGVEETVVRAAPGGVIVAHDGGIPDRAGTVAALPALLMRLRAEGFRIVTVGELEALGPPVWGRPGVPPTAAATSPGVQRFHGTA